MPFSNGGLQDEAVLYEVLDALSEGLAFYHLDGELRFMNRAMRSLLEASSDADRIREELAAVVQMACGAASAGKSRESLRVEELAPRELHADRQRLHMRASRIQPGLFGTGPVLLVNLEVLSPASLLDEELRVRFGLTQQEIRVARLLGEGRSNAEIAKRLYISANTAQNHTRRVLEKLGLHSRAQVAAKLNGGRQEND
jgi:DNA-binding CsgD family transcriptional regulator